MTRPSVRPSSAPCRHVDVAPSELATLPAGTRIVDVREPFELIGELGRVPGSELVPVGDVAQASPTWNPDDPILLVCRSGNRSGRVATWLAERGFGHVMNLAGGMIAYNEARLPVER